MPSATETQTLLPPGPKAPAVTQTLRWALRPVELLEECAKKYGNTFTLTLSPMGKWVFLSDPKDVQQVFRAKPDDVPSATSQSVITPVVGPNSLLILNGSEHMRQRKLLLPPFHGERMKAYGEIIAEATERVISEWPLGKPFKLQPEMQKITLEVIERAVFGVTDDENLEQLRQAIVSLLKISQSPLILPLVWRNIGQEEPSGFVKRQVEKLDEQIYAEINRHRNDPDLQQREDILSLLLTARDEDGQPMTDKELRDELVTLLLAGHETTATTIAWAFERLMRTPIAMDRLSASLVRGESEYLDAVFEETLRSRPIVPIVVRKLAAPMTLGGYDLPTGTNISLNIYGIHHRADLYPNPGAFKPERFLDSKAETYSWIPFGGGVRRCIGATFADFEAKTVIRTIFANGLTLRAENHQPEAIRRRNVTLIPSRGAVAIVTRQ